MHQPGLRVFLTATAALLPVLAPAAQPMDEEFARHVREWTTKPEFSSPLVDHLPVSDAVPSPRQVLGHDIGAPNTLDYYADLLKYYRALAAKSPRVRVLEIGKTEEGRENVVVMLSSEDNIRNLETDRRNLAQLADPRGLSDEQAADLIAHTRPIYHFMGGLHSAETGPAEMLLELAYRLVAEDSPLLDRVRDNVVVAITPATDPDGRDRYTDWYYRNKVDDTDDLNPVPGAPYWGKYIFHDDNRDINYSGASARELLAYYLQWHPPIMHDLHESVPFLYSYSGQAPQNPNLDPILYGELPWFSNFEMSQLTRYGMPGVWTHGFVDAWSPGYVGFMASNHNGMLRFYETFGNGGATTMLRHVAPVPGEPKDPNRPDQTKREWFRPLPPYKEVQWSMRNNTNYMETAALTALQLTSQFPQVVLQNFYRKTRNSIEAGRTQAPYGYVFPADQPDMTRAQFVLNILRMQGIEVGRATQEIHLKEGTFPAASLVVKRDQPYGRLAKILLEKQQYPEGDLRSYDDTAWTMGLMAHTRVIESADPKVLEVPVEPVERFEVRGEMGPAHAAAYAVLDYGSPNLALLRYRLKGVPISIAEQSFQSAGRTVPGGSFLFEGKAYERLKPQVESLGLRALALDSRPDVPSHPAALPRIAIYSTWGSTQNVGWVRYTFDQLETPYDLIFKERLRKGGLHSAYDVIIIPSQGRSGRSLVYDLEMHGKALPYTRTSRYKYLGAYGASEDIRGGMGLEGLLELRKFVAAGGTLITLGEASEVPAEFDITPTIEVSHPTQKFYAPGPIVQARILKPKSPIFYGYEGTDVSVRWATNSLLHVKVRDKDRVLMEFPGGAKNVLSGEMRGAEEVEDRPAIIDMPVDKGRVVLFVTNPIYRWQNVGEFRMLYNALLSYRNLE
ncbi:MAG TPA: M14 family zinc carboxypeptidase [Steroidobacteraceae bacterium]|nr:M14 family zinc carboxypeptidase [Steroidobacteraceae bacterium]